MGLHVDQDDRHGGPGILARETPLGPDRVPFVFRINIAAPNPRLYSLAFVGTQRLDGTRVKIAAFRGKCSRFSGRADLENNYRPLRE